MTDSTDGTQAAMGAVTALADAVKQWASVVPDLTTVPVGGLTASPTAPLFADVVDYQALHHVAQRLADEVIQQLQGSEALHMLVTGDTTLAISESLSQGVGEQLRELLTQAYESPGATPRGGFDPSSDASGNSTPD